MLGKTANGLYWMYRYLERAENTSRLIETGQRIGLTRSGTMEWGSVMQTAGVAEGYAAHRGEVTQDQAIDWMLRDPDTPTWAKGVIVGALGYLILPADLVPDLIPGAGYGDDWAALVAALGTVATYVKDIHKIRATAQTERLFGRHGR